MKKPKTQPLLNAYHRKRSAEALAHNSAQPPMSPAHFMTQCQMVAQGSRREEARLAKSSTKEPSVGVFWWWRGQLLAVCNALPNAEEFHGILNGAQDHVQVWARFQGQFPALRGTDYIEVPRGRVLYRQRTRKFTVYLDRALATPKVKTAISSGFGLPPAQTIFRFDPHYTTDSDVLDAMFGDGG